MLLDSSPKTWGSREELHLRFSRALIARGIRPVLVFSDSLPDGLRSKYRVDGIEVEVISYERGILHFYRELGRLIKRHSATTVHVAFFNYFSLVPWMARLRGVSHIIFQERNSGVLRAKSWKKQLLRLRTRATTFPTTQVIAISEYLKRQLTEAGLPAKKIVVVYHGVDLDRFSLNSKAREQLLSVIPIQPQDFLIVTATSLLAWKNPRVTIEACALLAKRGVPMRLVYAGVGP